VDVEEQISQYLAGLPEARRGEMQLLDRAIRELLPDGKIWFLDGKDETGKVVSNPNIGYGQRTMHYADGKTRDFYQIGISANTSGISVYILGLDDKKYLSENFGSQIGKAAITGYCIKFRKLAQINLDVLRAAVKQGVERT
jgi:hypothetical protein